MKKKFKIKHKPRKFKIKYNILTIQTHPENSKSNTTYSQTNTPRKFKIKHNNKKFKIKTQTQKIKNQPQHTHNAQAQKHKPVKKEERKKKKKVT